MAFKMKGSPAKLGTISGTAGHRSALKAKTDEVLSSAFKISKEGYNEDGTPKFTDTKKTTDTSKSEENIKKSNIFILRRIYLQQVLSDIKKEMTYGRSSQFINNNLIKTPNTRVTN